MDMKIVDTVARGLVYMGDGALQIGLVDKSGGLDCDILFAQQNITSSGKAQVLDWPPK
jgi:ClpP class serine protease